MDLPLRDPILSHMPDRYRLHPGLKPIQQSADLAPHMKLEMKLTPAIPSRRRQAHPPSSARADTSALRFSDLYALCFGNA
jgi:hypothetical protein